MYTTNDGPRMNRGGPMIERVVTRHRFLRVVDHEWATKGDIEDRLDVSRSTVDRTLRELVQWGLIERSGSNYRRTAAGTLVLTEFDRFEDRTGAIEQAAELLDQLDVEPDIDGSVFEDAEIVRADRNSPHRPVDAHGKRLEYATKVKTIGAAVLPQLVETYHRRIVNDGVEAEILLSQEVLTRLLSAYREQLNEGLQSGRASIREIDFIPEYSMMIAETPTGTELGCLFYSGTEVTGFIGTDNKEAICWATNRFDQLWESAEPLVELAID